MRLRVLAAGMLSLLFASRIFAAACDPDDARLLKPELVAQLPAAVHLVTRPGHRWLIFSSSIANLGDGPLLVYNDGTTIQQEIRRTDGTFCTHEVGPAGDQGFHIDDFAEYQLRRDDPVTGDIVARSTKTAVCLMNNIGLSRSARPAERFDCNSPNGVRGISVGFVDTEDSASSAEAIDLDADSNNPVPAGNYFLVTVENPDGVLLEKANPGRAPNAVISIAVRGGQHQMHRPRTRPTLHRPTPAPNPTPATNPTPVTIPTPVPHSGGTSMVLPPGHEGCGGHHAKRCSPGEFCEYLENRCRIAGDIGVCKPLGRNCGTQSAPVCGCDGVTYRNACERQRAGVSAAHQGPC